MYYPVQGPLRNMVRWIMDDRYTLVQLPVGEVQWLWPAIEDLLVETKDTWDSLYTLDSIHQLIQTGYFQVWSLIRNQEADLTFITQVRDYPLGRALQIVWCEGRGHMDSFLSQLPGLEAHCKRMGYRWIDIWGRPGWEKVMKPMGFNLAQVALRKELGAAPEFN